MTSLRLALLLSLFWLQLIHGQNATQSGWYSEITPNSLPAVPGKNIIVARMDAAGTGVAATYGYAPGTKISVYRSSQFGGLRVGYTWTENLVTVRQWKQWAQAVPVTSGAPLPNINGGIVDDNGDLKGPNGEPIDENGNPTVTTGDYHGNGTENNGTGKPARPVLTFTPTDGSPPYTLLGPEIEPGQNYDWDIDTDRPGMVDVDWDIGDGIIVPGSGISTPVQGTPGGDPPNTGGRGRGGITPGLTPPADAAQGDVTGAVNRHAQLTQTYGEAARQAANFQGNKLSDIKDLFGDAIDKLESIDSKTGQGGEGGATEETLQSIEGGIGTLIGNTSVDAPTITPPADIPQEDPETFTGQLNSIRDSMASAGTALQGTVNSLGLGNDFGSASWNFEIPIPGWTTIYLPFESWAGWFLNIVRSIMLGFVSLNFVRELINVIRGALVG